MTCPLWLSRDTGLTDRQLEYWRYQGLFHVPLTGSGYKFPWEELLPRIEWLRRVSVARYGKIGGKRANLGGLDYWDGRAGVDLIGRTEYAIRVGREPWVAWDAASWEGLETIRESFMVAAVPSADWRPGSSVG